MSHGIISEKSQSLIDWAYEFAEFAHRCQVRKYTGEPYINHPVEVAQIVATVTDDVNMICAALLHDVVEDTWVTQDLLYQQALGFRHPVANLVYWLTDQSKKEDGNRKIRKEIDRNHIAQAPADAKTIKLADLISNSKSIVVNDPQFAKIYMNEKRLLLTVLEEGNATLYKRASEIINEYYGEVK